MNFTKATRTQIDVLLMKIFILGDTASIPKDGICAEIERIINTQPIEKPNYNGWNSQETWIVNNYITQSKAVLNYWQSQAMAIYNHAQRNEVPKIVNARETLAKELRRVLGEIEFNPYQNHLQSSFLQCAIDKVDWEEIAQSLLDQLKDIGRT